MEPFLEGTSVHYKKHNPKRIHINKRMNFTVCKITDSLIVKCQTLKKNMQFLYFFLTETVIEKHTTDAL